MRSNLSITILSLVTLSMLLGCASTENTNQRPLPAHIPLYSETADAKITNVIQAKGSTSVFIETINGIQSPIAFYKSALSEWHLAELPTVNGGTLKANIPDESVYIEFTQLPGGSTEIILKYEY